MHIAQIGQLSLSATVLQVTEVFLAELVVSRLSSLRLEPIWPSFFLGKFML